MKQELCEDEGRPNYGIVHICISRTSKGEAMKLTRGVATMSFYSLIVMRYMLEHEVHIYGNELAVKFDITSGTIYPMLHRWEKRGWVSSKVERNNFSNRPDRRYYAITEKGKGIGRWALKQLQLCDSHTEDRP